MPSDNEFGHWTNTDERLQELFNRLAAWEISGNQLPEIFDTAAGIFAAGLADAEDVFEVDPILVITAFEEALHSFDAILAAFPQTLRCPGCGHPLDEDGCCLTNECSEREK